MLRMQLFRMKPFVSTCKSRTTLLGMLEPRAYYIDNTEYWALADFPRVRRRRRSHVLLMFTDLG